MKIKKVNSIALLLLICFCSVTNTKAQGNEKLGSWYVYNGFFNFSPKFELFAETQIRNWEPVSNIQTFFIRPFFNFNLTNNFQLGISQEYHSSWSFAEDTDDKIQSEEYRTSLQAFLFQKIGTVSLQHRYRYEFRFLDEKGNQRARYRLQLGIPLSGETIEKGSWFTTLGNEIMINTQREFSLSQNRAYAMLGYQISQNTHLQCGYMNISYPDQNNAHRLQFFITQKLNFYDK